VAPIITGIIVHFRFHIRCISIHKLMYFNFFSASFCTTFIIIIIKSFPLKTLLGCYLFVNICCMLCIHVCSHIPYHSPCSKLLRKSFGFYAIKITIPLTGLIIEKSGCRLGILHSERTSVLGEMLLETTLTGSSDHLSSGNGFSSYYCSQGGKNCSLA
jgi:hypothetical protein